MTKLLKDWQLAKVHSDDSNLERLLKRPELYPNTRWVGGYKVGGGSFGIATLWALVDTVTRKAIAHIVIKDAFESTRESTAEEGIYTDIYRQLVNKGLDLGVDPTHEAGKAAPELRFLKEAYLQGLMTAHDASEEIYAVPLYGYARKLLPTPHSRVHNHWRLYLPLYDYGDLQGVISAHTVKQQAIPEPFIWHTLICLMKAAVQLEEQARLRPHPTDSDVIVVFDMKPANILLAPPKRGSTFPIYPRPHIADLGGGGLTNQKDPVNLLGGPSFSWSPGYMAPEMSDAQYKRFLRDTCTNVWQIGRVLELMMKLRPDSFGDPSYNSIPGLSGIHLTPRILTYNYWLPAQENYSDMLKQMVAECLRFEPATRPSPQDLLARIENLKHLFQGMDTFGSDTWFDVQHQTRAALPPPPKPQTEAENIAAQAAEAEKRRRIKQARPYLSTWGQQRVREYVHLGFFAPEHQELLYSEEANWWATEPLDFIQADGKPVRPLPLPQPVVVAPVASALKPSPAQTSAAHPGASKSSSSYHLFFDLEI
jgi:serine/threonine protein kinase